MDEETGRRFDQQDETLRRIEASAVSTNQALQTHLIAYAGEHAATKAEVDGVGTRLNEHIEQGNKMRPFWFSIVLAALTGVVKVLWDLVRNKP